MDNEFFATYVKFVNSVTSDQSKQYTTFERSLYTMKTEHLVPPERLLTATLGLSAEAGEFGDLVKKCIFQGKELNEENKLHMKKELGDIMWYMAQACMALDTDFNEILSMNVEKLSARYPEGTFDVEYSENRKEGDL